MSGTFNRTVGALIDAIQSLGPSSLWHCHQSRGVDALQHRDSRCPGKRERSNTWRFIFPTFTRGRISGIDRSSHQLPPARSSGLGPTGYQLALQFIIQRKLVKEEGQEVTDRLQRLRNVFDSMQADAALITHPTNRRYLSGFPARSTPDESYGVLLVTSDQALLYTSTTNLPWAVGTVRNSVEARPWSRPWQNFIGEQLLALGCQRVAFEDVALPVADYSAISSAATAVELVPAGDAIHALRSAEEIPKRSSSLPLPRESQTPRSPRPRTIFSLESPNVIRLEPRVVDAPARCIRSRFSRDRRSRSASASASRPNISPNHRRRTDRHGR